MDNLARDAMLAREAGMTYGRWKAMQKPAKPVKKEIPEGWKECPQCKKLFKPNRANQIYCDIGCRTKAYAPKARAAMKEYHAKRMERKHGKQKADA